jgi:hypothetical protein
MYAYGIYNIHTSKPCRYPYTHTHNACIHARKPKKKSKPCSHPYAYAYIQTHAHTHITAGKPKTASKPCSHPCAYANICTYIRTHIHMNCRKAKNSIKTLQSSIASRFPLGEKALHDVVRWTDPGHSHVTGMYVCMYVYVCMMYCDGLALSIAM